MRLEFRFIIVVRTKLNLTVVTAADFKITAAGRTHRRTVLSVRTSDLKGLLSY